MKITITYAEELRSVVPLSRAILRRIGVKRIEHRLTTSGEPLD